MHSAEHVTAALVRRSVSLSHTARLYRAAHSAQDIYSLHVRFLWGGSGAERGNSGRDLRYFALTRPQATERPLREILLSLLMFLNSVYLANSLVRTPSGKSVTDKTSYLTGELRRRSSGRA